MKTSPFLLVLGLVSTTARADDDAFEKTAQFTAALQGAIDGVAKDCKLQLAVTTNVAVADLSLWGGNPRQQLRAAAAPCAAAIDGIRSMCNLSDNKEAWRRVAAREVKGVRCQFTGHQPRKKGETANGWMYRNMTFVNGVLAVKMSPDMRSPGHVAGLVVFGGLVGKPGAPAISEDTADDTDEPVQDTREEEPKPREQERAAKPKGSEKGRMCSKDKDCQSGACKMENKTRGRCQ